MAPWRTLVLLMIFSLLPASLLHAQRHDHTWLLGRDGSSNNPMDSANGITVLDFNTASLSPLLYYDGRFRIDFALTANCMSDREGRFLFAYNGYYIEDSSGQTMQGAQALNPSGQPHFGDGVINGGLIIPYPDQESKYLLFHLSWYFNNMWTYGQMLYLSLIDTELNGGLGGVVIRKDTIIEDTLDLGKMTATKHANGRDWWVLVPEHESNRFYTLLITPDGVTDIHLQEIGVYRPFGLGQTTFSSDGSRMIIMNMHEINPFRPSYLDLFDFDRCTGILSNHRQHIIDQKNTFANGAAISPSGRFLYLCRRDTIFQVDLELDSFIKTPVAIYDGFISSGNPVPTYFGIAQTGPDGRIYITSTSTIVYELTVINHPDRPGIDCDVRQHSLRTPTAHTTLPQHPYYRLGPLDGSPCDTLGIDNIPVALFRWDQDTLDPLTIHFTDLSYYEPQSWTWSFDDGSQSPDRYPIHSYDAPGDYEVCLSVDNPYGTHTSCRTIRIGTTAVSDPAVGIHIATFPNPARDQVTFQLPDYLPVSGRIRISDLRGQVIRSAPLRQGWTQVDISNLPPGIYLWLADDGGVLIGSGKILKHTN